MKRILPVLLLVATVLSCKPKTNREVKVNNAINVQTDASFVQTVTFPSLDSTTITADVYHVSKLSPVILLCHQANYSRGEYIETAKLLNSWGYNCIAIDQRSGSEVNNVVNETAKAAQQKNLPTEYLDAEQDIVAAINFTYNLYTRSVIVLGSSYSASLALKLAKENPKISMAIAFSPGEHFDAQLNLLETIKGLDKPVFIASSKKEAPDCKVLFDAVNNTHKTQFIPVADGFHGSKSLWSANKGNEEYRDALRTFLSNSEPPVLGL